MLARNLQIPWFQPCVVRIAGAHAGSGVTNVGIWFMVRANRAKTRIHPAALLVAVGALPVAFSIALFATPVMAKEKVVFQQSGTTSFSSPVSMRQNERDSTLQRVRP